MSNTMIFYRGDSNWYMRIVEIATGKIWNFAEQQLHQETIWSKSVLRLVFSNTIGGHPVELPDLPESDYDLLFYDDIPADVSDTLVVGKPYTESAKFS